MVETRLKKAVGQTGKLKILIVAGGTGGHIFPALAIGEKLSCNGKLKFKFISGRKPVDKRLYGRAGAPVIKISAVPLRKSRKGHPVERILRKAGAIIANLWASLQALMILMREKPDGVLAMGGYVTAPVIAAASFLCIPVIIHEQNCIPGRTNRLLAPLAHSIICSYEKTKEIIRGRSDFSWSGRQGDDKKLLNLGNPIRETVVAPALDGGKERAIKYFSLNNGGPSLLITGGSQGARFFNFKVLDILKDLDEIWEDNQLQVVWSAGLLNYEKIKRAVAKIKWKKMVFRLMPFIEEMGLAYAAADFAISRAGAIALSELAACGIPSLLIPFPYAVDRHQYYNAQTLAQAGAAIMIEEKKISPKELAHKINQLLKDKEKLKQMSESARSMARPRAAQAIADYIITEFSAVV